MRLNCKSLRAEAERAGASPEKLAVALPMGSSRRKAEDAALRSVRNWMAGRDQPRATRKDIEALAGALGVAPSRLARFTTVSRFQRSSPSKSRLVADMIRGRRVDEADTLLSFSPRRAAVMVRKALRTAIADAEAHDVPVDRLYVAESRVDEGVIIKRFHPKDRGRAHPIQKKTSHIVVGVEERA